MKSQKEKESSQDQKSAPPKFILKDGHQLQEVFVLDGIKYFEFVDSNMAPCHRMFTAMAYYNELKMRCDREYLIAHSQAVEDCLNAKSGSIELTKLAMLNRQLKERVEWIIEPETVFKYASVVIFDETEDPYSYDFKYNNQVKIPKWKQQNWAGFFLSMPVQRLFPLSNISQEDLAEYLKIQVKVNLTHLQEVSQALSSNSSIKESLDLLISQSEQALA